MTAFARLAVFDVDGTLIDSQHNIVAAMTAAYAAHGVACPHPDAVRRIIGLSLVEAVARLSPEEDDSRHVAIAHSYKEAFSTLRQQADHSEPLYPGAVEALAALEEAGWLLGIATGKTRRGLDSMLERHGFHGRFVTLQTADGNPGKPHPGMLLRALGETGMAAIDSVMIGDTIFDMIMAKGAGVHPVGVTWGYHPPEDLVEAGAEVMVDEYSSLPPAVAALFGRTECALGQS
jgi:phosphoglycolate phosphatase